MPYPSREGKNDPKGASPISRAAIAATGSEHTSPGRKAVSSVVSEVSVVQAAPAQGLRSKATANGQGSMNATQMVRGQGPPSWPGKHG